VLGAGGAPYAVTRRRQFELGKDWKRFGERVGEEACSEPDGFVDANNDVVSESPRSR